MANLNLKHLISSALLLATVPMVASAVAPIAVKTVPWVATAPATPHQSWDGKQIALKGTANLQDTGSGNIQYIWDPGDGTAACTGTVTNQYVIECLHTYTAAHGATIGNVFAATLTVFDSTTGPSGGPYTNSAIGTYYVQIYAPPSNLTTEVNVAIDEGLWYLHKTMARVGTGGSITSVTVTNPGANYQMEYAPSYSSGYCCSAVSFTISEAGSGGSGASLSGTIDSNSSSATYGQIISINIDNPGNGYTAPITLTANDDECYYKTYYTYYYQGACGTGGTGSATASAMSTIYSGTWNGNSPGGVTATNCTAFEVSGTPRKRTGFRPLHR